MDYNKKNKETMDIIITIIQIIGLVLGIYFLFSGLYFILFSVASLFYKDKVCKTKPGILKNVIILIPAYKEDSVIVDTAMDAVKHKSNLTTIDVYVLADGLKESTISKLKKLPINIINVELKNSSKSKSIKFALQHLKIVYDYAIILDADNIMGVGFVDKIIQSLNSGYRVVQGHRVAKNLNTSFAVLDAVSEEVNNSIFRSGHHVLGLSASLIGSGFGIDYRLLQLLINQSYSIGGFDKELELMIIKKKITIGYNKGALVFDEKVQKSEDFVNQRRRWLSAQLIYLFKQDKPKEHESVVHLDYLDKKLQFIVPPRILSLGLSVIVVSLLVVQMFFMTPPILIYSLWVGSLLLNIFAVLIAIPVKLYNGLVLRALFSIPKGFILTLVALLNLKNANSTFIHTTHGIKSK